ncbi:MAG: chorismate synthase [Dehalococcoidia bacterium]
MNKLRFMTTGESHGKGILSILEGMVAGLLIDEDMITYELKRRQAGYGRGGRMKIESDTAEILSGVRYGYTIGSPISIYIQNKDWKNWRDKMSVNPVETTAEPITSPRPGHADLAGMIKYGTGDTRPVLERASARETAARVAAGAVAKKFLEVFDITVHSHTIGIGKVNICGEIDIDWQKVENSPVRCADDIAEKAMITTIDEAKAAGDTLGGILEVVIYGVPVGLGSYVQWDRRLDMRIAGAIMSIQAVKGVEIGPGCALASMMGSEAHDIIEPDSQNIKKKWSRPTNNAGGIEGGMTNGEPVIIRAALKPIATLGKPLKSIDMSTGDTTQAHYERSDICVVPAAGVIGEAMAALVLADAMLEKFGGDTLSEISDNYRNYIWNAKE